MFGEDDAYEQSSGQNPQLKKALVSSEVAALLEKAGEGSLGETVSFKLLVNVCIALLY